MTNTPTPRTDAKYVELEMQDLQRGHQLRELIKHAQHLERELNEARLWIEKSNTVQYVMRIEAERDKWKAAHDNQVNLKRMLTDRPDLKERAGLIEQLCEERDQLRKVVDALANIIYVHSLRPQNALDAYNQLPHVLAKTERI